MIHNIKRIGSTAKAVVSGIHIKKRAHELVTYAGISAIGAAVNLPSAKLVTEPLADEFVYIFCKAKSPLPKHVLPRKRAVKTAYPFSQNWEEFFKNKDFAAQTASLNAKHKAEELKLHTLIKKTNAVLKIMQEDKNCIQHDKEKIARLIVKVADEYNTDPFVLACIAKKESHFTQDSNKSAAKGIMQITKITVRDMYQKGREGLYPDELNDLKKKYKTSEELFSALQSDTEVNIRAAAILYKALLNKAKGDVKKALINYNGSPQKHSYANTVFKDIKKYSQTDSSFV